MFDKAAIIFLYTETPLHAGSGTSLGIVDLPIQRERSTGYPMIQASGLKGCLRDAVRDASKEEVAIIFGPDTDRASEHAGAVSVGDARILLFPVRSLMGVFAWITSQNVLARFKREAGMAGVSAEWDPVGPTSEDSALVASESCLVANEKIVLEEFAFRAETRGEIKKIAEWLKEHALPEGDEYRYWRESLEKRLVVLPENAFRDFVMLSTEVIARVRVDDETKTVARGALWTEEHLPSDTLLYATVFASKPRVAQSPEKLGNASAILEFIRQNVGGKRLQLGGDATVGRGIVKVRITREEVSKSISQP